MSDLAEKVRAAADYIERTGLFKGGLYDTARWAEEHGLDYPEESDVVAAGYQCCTIGALLGFEAYRARIPFAEFLGVSASEGIPQWNDAPERTAEEVVAKLREFADTL